MPQPSDVPSASLEYATTHLRWPWKQYLLGLITTPIAYLLVYLAFRVTGVFHPYFSQGSWEIEGGTGVYVIDMSFYPLAIIEGDMQNRLRWLPEPTGG